MSPEPVSDGRRISALNTLFGTFSRGLFSVIYFEPLRFGLFSQITVPEKNETLKRNGFQLNFMTSIQSQTASSQKPTCSRFVLLILPKPCGAFAQI